MSGLVACAAGPSNTTPPKPSTQTHEEGWRGALPTAFKPPLPSLTGTEDTRGVVGRNGRSLIEDPRRDAARGQQRRLKVGGLVKRYEVVAGAGWNQHILTNAVGYRRKPES